MQLADVIAASARFGMWAHVATVSPSGTPYVTPVHPCWEGETLWTMVGTDSAKARNVAANPMVSFHWQVGPETDFDGLMIWGRAEVFSDVETKRRLWTGVFDYDLDAFAPGGPDDSEGTAFMAVQPTKAVLLKQFGSAGRDDWSA